MAKVLLPMLNFFLRLGQESADLELETLIAPRTAA
jgi:hypothetical protein